MVKPQETELLPKDLERLDVDTEIIFKINQLH